ncbi:hypothetical protein PV04_04564 [Phialophora macrospora]|uniref:ATP-grasp domain-containing protein n=1 Tax=Phialophora macrospora TaxID=1851006 RepID=A0A0D2FPX1_9EURO|nr:hypothetical protein PV04_04564 [Phialophora macrospora]
MHLYEQTFLFTDLLGGWHLAAGSLAKMLDSNSSLLAHRVQNAALLFLSLALLPLDSIILFLSLILRAILPSRVERHRRDARQEHGFQPHTVLVTGVGMTKGLALARLFYQAGHDVVGADFEPDGAPVCGRVSRSVKKFYSLEMPIRKRDAPPGSPSPHMYIQQLLDIVTREKVDLWVSCSGVASAIEDGMAKEVLESRTSCKAIQFDVRTTQRLHEKHSFIQHTRDTVGLRVPETHEITSRAAAERILRDTPAAGREYIMKPIGVDDAARADMTLLPRASAVDTAKHIARLKISETSPWILQQYIRGREYCTHSLVVDGRVKAFVACPSAELLMHYEALPFESPLSLAMLDFTTRYAAKGGGGGGGHKRDFTGHLSFDFMVEEEDERADSPESITLYPIECNPRAHTAVVLFDGTTEMVDAYFSSLEPDNSDDSSDANSNSTGTNMTPDPSPSPVVHPRRLHDKYFWLGHDLVTRVVLSTLSLLPLASPSASIPAILQNYAVFLTRLFTWRDGTYQLWDPQPWWWLYHVYWPVRFWRCLVQGKKWSRLNVSTTKMFEC